MKEDTIIETRQFAQCSNDPRRQGGDPAFAAFCLIGPKNCAPSRQIDIAPF